MTHYKWILGILIACIIISYIPDLCNAIKKHDKVLIFNSVLDIGFYTGAFVWTITDSITPFILIAGGTVIIEIAVYMYYQNKIVKAEEDG